MIGGHELGRLARAIGKPHENRRRLVDEVERAGNDVAGRVDHQAGRRARAEQHAIDLLQAADGFDANHRRGHSIHRGPKCRLLLGLEVVGRRGGR